MDKNLNNYKNEIVKATKIDGIIDLINNPITAEEFTNKFIEWIESNNWRFGGITGKYEDEYGDFE